MAADLVKFLKQTNLFRDLDDKALGDLSKMAQVSSFEKGEMVLEESEVGDEIFAIMKGRVDVSLKMPNGTLTDTIATLQTNDIFGESVILGKTRRIAAATARDQADIVRFKAKDLEACFIANPAVGYIVMRNLAQVIHERLTSTNMLLRNTLNRVVDII